MLRWIQRWFRPEDKGFDSTPDHRKTGGRLFYGMALGRVGAYLLSPRADLLITWGVMPLWSGHAEGAAWRAAATSGAIVTVPVEGPDAQRLGDFQAWFADTEDQPLPLLRHSAQSLLLRWSRMVCASYDSVDRPSLRDILPSVEEPDSPAEGIALCTDLTLSDLTAMLLNDPILASSDLPTLRLHMALSPGLLDALHAEEDHFRPSSGKFATHLEKQLASSWRAFQARQAEPNPEPTTTGLPPRKDAEITFTEQARLLRAALDTALLEAGEGGPMPAWEAFRPALGQIFLALGSPPRFQDLASELGRDYGLLLWALARSRPQDRGILDRFLERFAPRPWEGFLTAEPRHALDCYQALPGLSETRPKVFLVVAKAGILLAQAVGDDIAEGLIWSALAEFLLHNYGQEALAPHARHALKRLVVIGTNAILVMPVSFDPFEGPRQEVVRLLSSLPSRERKALRVFLADLEARHGEDLEVRNGTEARSWMK